jgi:hypothetical protein
MFLVQALSIENRQVAKILLLKQPQTIWWIRLVMITSGAIKLLSAEADQAVIDAQIQTDALKLLLRFWQPDK